MFHSGQNENNSQQNSDVSKIIMFDPVRSHIQGVIRYKSDVISKPGLIQSFNRVGRVNQKK
ncbi:hypothetical protein FBQ69_03310 [Salmonella enterica]|nr:hypothetical protein [Salmonella enterica]EAT8888711.1 hypothetical protein [Salmonella enterica subsp. arizonae serovar 53:z4,z23,z32:-]EBH9975167.1 hypothetical protein [Salmonella enterica subsp. arizonae serovar 40:z36:-]EBU3312160.1 hypothetical protein [Salmonella enterica subsp. arizonae]ECU5738552.1 hypothetical protein [Salmonella enterica subsp. arizonae serovar 40:z4,z23:-]EDU6452041.1 hypothetical protein [Salmonella enterica subsp. arizonae serovar 41:z4,z32:-]EDX6770394.1 hyp